MRITHLETYSVPIAGVQPPFAWRRGLRGAPPDGEGAVPRIGTASGAEGVALAPRRGAGRILQDMHRMGYYSQHLCMASPNTTYYESLVTSTEVTGEAVVDARGLVHALGGIGLGLPAGPDYPPELCHLVIDAAQSAAIL